MSIKQAIEALESCDPGDYSTGHVIYPSYDEDKVNAALAALRSMPQGEPVGWLCETYENGKLRGRCIAMNPQVSTDSMKVTPLYATTHTEAVRMSDQEIDAITLAQWGDRVLPAAHRAYARAVEQATAARLGVKMGDV